MIDLHASKALFAKLPVDDQGRLPIQQASHYIVQREVPLAVNPLSGWQAHLFTLQRRQCVLWVHGATRFPLFMSCLSKADFKDLQWRFVDTLMNTLLKAGASDWQMQTADALLQPLQIDSVCDRSMQATINRMKGDIEHSLYYHESKVADLSSYRTGAWLADRPTKVKGQKDYLWPQQEMLALLDKAASSLLDCGSLPPTETEAESEVIDDNVVSLSAYREERKP
ncbi:hypothetical protein [uncultured Pseudoteredinibacter sp.]|uniref:DUF6933 domain-containing protein n=1 Tax=uncultured Pseudoteredinibacter sp. TaxID=1641701 RepID=UPI002615C443|nr:hypothetical protein [uncultured Pseudoteredinibacter sp.]